MAEENPKTVASEKPTDNTEDDDAKGLLHEEAQVYFEPVVHLDEVEVVSGEEEEECIFKMRCKVFVFGETLLDKGTGKKQWRERGTGDIRLLKHKESGKIRILMRQEKTLKICINHIVDHRVELQPNVGSDRSWVWTAFDFSEGEIESTVFAVRFGNPENAKKFKEAYESAGESNKAIEEGKDAESTAEGDEAAEALESLNVKSSEEQESTDDKESSETSADDKKGEAEDSASKAADKS